MSAHLAHKIPWHSLVDFYGHTRPTASDIKKLQHAARTFARVLQEFEATHQATNEELYDFDPKQWGDYEFMMGNTAMGYYTSLVWGYIDLNLLLTDADRIQPLMLPNGGSTWAMDVLLGLSDCAHPPELADCLRPAFEGRCLKPLTPDVIEILSEHAARLFRCMYIMSGENKLLLEETCLRLFFGYFSWSQPIDS